MAFHWIATPTGMPVGLLRADRKARLSRAQQYCYWGRCVDISLDILVVYGLTAAGV